MDGIYAEVESHFNQRQHIAHGMDHAVRVARLARFIATKEEYDPDEAEITGILHDIGRTVQKEESGHGPAGVPLAAQLLKNYTNFNADKNERILNAIRDHSNLTTEGTLTHIVQDADMLDGLGAIGIMRAYTSKAQLICYDPANIIPTTGKRDATIHEQIAFQMEWLDMMHTETGKHIAKERGDRMVRFLEEFKLEALGEDYLR